MTVPSGWRAPVNPAGAPDFFRHVRTDAGGVDYLDFELTPDPLSVDTDFRFVALADVHVQDGTLNTPDSYRGQLRQINELAHQLADDCNRPRFLVVAGDLTNDATHAEFRDYASASAESALPVWSVPGNHDLTGRSPGGPYPKPQLRRPPYRDVIDAYRTALGPEWYSFQYGHRHFVVLENYRGLSESDQLLWLGRDLAANGAGREVVVIAHVPWDVPQTQSAHTAPYLELFGSYDIRLLLAGHTHSSDVASGVIGRAVQAVTTSAAYTLDQTPKGFRLVEFQADRIRLPTGEFDADRWTCVAYPAGTVASRPASVWVNHYRPPGVQPDVEFQFADRPWRTLRAIGSRSWAAPLDLTDLERGRTHLLRVRVRDRAVDPWQVQDAAFEVASGDEVTPRQGAPWRMFHGDSRHSGVARDAVFPPLALAWIQHAKGAILTSSPAVAHDTVFIGTRDDCGEEGNGVIALDIATGKQRWRVDTRGAVEGTVAVAGDIVLAPSVKGPLWALDAATGAVRWRWPRRGELGHCWMYFSPTVVDDLVYQSYIDPSGGWMVAIDVATGEPRWHTNEAIGRNWLSHGSPAVAGNRLVFATAYANIVALDARSGHMQWQVAFDGWTRTMPVLADGIVLLACQGDRLFAVDAKTGAAKWSHGTTAAASRPSAQTAATPAVADGVVFAGFADGSIRALSLEDGDLRWRYRTGAAVISSPVVSGDCLYVGSNDGIIRALDRGRGTRLWAHEIGAWVASTPAVTGNAVVVGAWDGNVYAFMATGGAEA